MKLHILSDLHIEVSSFEVPATDADVVVLAGDIDIGDDGIHWARKAFPDKPIVYLCGNHEFYHSNRAETMAQIRIAAQECDVHLLDDDEFVYDNVRFLGSTLWTDFRLFGEEMQTKAMNEGQRGLSDLRVIQEDSTVNFSPARSIDLHKLSLDWLKAKLDEPFDGKTVVVTHHLPSMQSVSQRYKGSLLSACFASELGYLFGKMDIWIHGHTHDSKDYVANGTSVICNPRGYVTYHCGPENYHFNPSLVVEI